ncbi:hypothetical protein [Bacillus sp. FSL K6-3431]|uniref:hypothetical protein n=1 Tax=Bacillus sp. FSL K6-3431 TaxID=2921500 RepID=UPI0030F99346
MNKDDQDIKQFLEDQLQWSEEQIRILYEMNRKFHQMKEKVEYALEHGLTSSEVIILNGHLDVLKNEVTSLEKRMYPVYH